MNDEESAKVPEREPRVIHKHVEDELKIGHEQELTIGDQSGLVRREMSMRTDGRKEGSIDIDRSGPQEQIRISGSKCEPANNVADENDCAASLATALAKVTGKTVQAIPKEKEDSDFPDVWLLCNGERVGVQITHVDAKTIGKLNTKGAYLSQVSTDDLAGLAVHAIVKKQKIDQALAKKTYLLLISPYPIRPALHEAICKKVAEASPLNCYLETWIASLSEPAFRIQ